MTTQEKETLKKELKKVIKKAGDTLYMTAKQMENNTATVLATALFKPAPAGSGYNYINDSAAEQDKQANLWLASYQELLKGFPVTITTEIKTQYGLDYLYIRLSY